jgi:hypothetical protein
MSKTKKEEAGKSPDLKKISAPVVKRIWSQIDFHDWQAIVQTAHPDGRWKGTNNGLKGRCPFHDDKDPSFVVDLQRGHAKCFSSDCGKYFWDPIRFYAALQPFPMSYPNALKELKDRYDIKVPKNAIAQINKRWEHRQMKRVLYEVMNGELCDAHTYLSNPNPAHPPPPDITYAKDALLFLERRDIKPVYHCLPIGIMPTRLKLEQRVREYAQTTQTKDYWTMADEYLSDITPDWIGSIVFFTGDSPDDPCKLKFRKIPMHGVSHSTDDKSIRFVTDSYEENNGIFGLFGTRTLLPVFAARDVKKFHFFEGEFDVLSVLSRQIQDSHLGFLPFSGGGSSTSGLDTMAHYGFETGYIVGDWDKAGEEWPKHILEQTVKIHPRIFRWPDSLRIKDNDPDPDLAVRVHGLEKFEEEMNKEENFEMPHVWAFGKAKKELSGIDQDDVRRLTRKAAEWGAYVRNPAERHAFITSVCDTFKIVNAGQIHGEIDRGDDNEEAFIERVRNTLENRFHVLQKLRDGNSHILRVWDKKSEEIIDLPIAEKHRLLSAVESMAGKDLYRWVYDDVGEPGHFVPFEEAKRNHLYVTQGKKLMDYVASAVSRLGGRAIPGKEPRKLGAGFHIEDRSSCSAETMRAYLVNGVNLYRGEFTNDGVTWTACDGPRDGGVCVYVETNRRPPLLYPQIQNVSVLHAGPSMSIGDLYNAVHEMIDIGWDFKHQTPTVDFLTGFVLLLFISDVVSRQPTLMLTANQKSGKTSLIGGLIGRKALPRINLVQCAAYWDNFTAAGVRQTMDKARLCCCLDEFEDDGSNQKKATAVRSTLALLRGMANEESSYTQGTVSGVAREITLRFPVVIAAIRPLLDPADLSRFIVLEMDRRHQRANPEAILLDRFGEGRIAEIRNAMPVIMLIHAFDVWKAHNAIREEYRDGGELPPAGREPRTREQVYGVMAVMRVAGQNERQFAEEFFSSYDAQATRTATTTLSNSLFNAVFYTPMRIQDEFGTREANVATLVQEQCGAHLKGAGVVHDDKTNWLLVHWPTIKHGLLQRVGQFSRLDTGALKTHAARCDRSVAFDEIPWDDIARRGLLLAGALPEHLSVFSLDGLVEGSAAGLKGIENIPLDPSVEARLATMTFPKPPKNTGEHHDTRN